MSFVFFGGEGECCVLVDFKNRDVCSVLFYALPPCCPKFPAKVHVSRCHVNEIWGCVWS